MKALAFDTLKYSKRLVEAGFTDRQAEALAEEQAALVTDQLATKQDIAEIKRDMKEMETRFDARLISLEHRLTVRLGGMLAAAVIVMAALVKLL